MNSTEIEIALLDMLEKGKIKIIDRKTASYMNANNKEVTLRLFDTAIIASMVADTATTTANCITETTISTTGSFSTRVSVLAQQEANTKFANMLNMDGL